jgi:hypothetical protein
MRPWRPFYGGIGSDRGGGISSLINTEWWLDASERFTTGNLDLKLFRQFRLFMIEIKKYEI